jgi:hypothetical protein
MDPFLLSENLTWEITEFKFLMYHTPQKNFGYSLRTQLSAGQSASVVAGNIISAKRGLAMGARQI